MNILAAKAILNLGGNSRLKYIEELFNVELMHLLRKNTAEDFVCPLEPI
jgi:hypothetical protein